MSKIIGLSIANVIKRVTFNQTHRCLHLPSLSVRKDKLVQDNSLSNTNCSRYLCASVPLSKLDIKKLLSFVCKKCNYKNTKFISKQAYEKGVVIVRCDGCNNNHLIADNLGWFQLGNIKNVEDILAAKGESVTKEISSDGSMEVLNVEKTDM